MPRFDDDYDDEDLDDFENEVRAPDRNCLPEEVHTILHHADYFELLALDPTKGPRRRGKSQTFHGWPILDMTVLLDEASRHELVTALNQGLADWSGEMAHGAFAPRYAFRAMHGEQMVDVLLCFECHEAAVYLDEGEAEWLHLSGRPAAALVYDTIFRAAGLPRAE